MSAWTDVAAVAELPPGGCQRLDVDGVAVAVFNVEGRYYAIEDVCSHEAETLSGGPVYGLEITCPRHEARFSLVTGEALSPPAYEPIAVFPVRVEAGRVQVRDDRFD
ncbi:MAG: ferredoxin [Betaproteobacteria bacterium HGW-Betaproteobacteria-12]|nr:MAG: ferredoxin [Betaproteobacteria bacterium HGW-Betaproteobacteria-12]